MLPFLNSSRGNAKKQIVSFRGINFSDRYTDGDMLDCMNLSARRFPFLTTRRARKHLTEYDGASAFLYRDKPICVKGTDLIYDGRVVAQVTEGEKQFALVNTKLCVFPDKIYVDTKTLEVKKLNEGVNTGKGAKDITVANNVLEDGQIESAISTEFLSATGKKVYLTSTEYNGRCKIYTYGKNETELEKCWNATEGKWDETALAVLEDIRELYDSEDFFVITDENGKISPSPTTTSNPSKTRNTTGAYAKVTSYGSDTVAGIPYVVGGGAHRFTDVFKVGDAVSITGTRGGVYDTDKALLNGVEDNRLSFGGEVFKVLYNGVNVVEDVEGATPIRSGLKAGKYYVKCDDSSNLVSYFKVNTPLSGRYSIVTPKFYSTLSHGSLYVFDIETRTISEKCELVLTDHDHYIDDYISDAENYIFLGTVCEVNTPDTEYVSFSKPYPDLDFVCESENRLWGCSNKDKTIYASALGDPTNFYTYNGLSTDSFTVAVGTAGEFTGCCKHSSSVLFWKEATLHKILGSFPAEYLMYTYEMEGLQKGSHKSMQIINDVLFFLGNHGVYAFNGSTPSLISPNFGETYLTKGVAGNDGDTYYLSAWEGDTCHLLLYETRSGQWMKEDATNAADFARVGQDLYMLNDTGEVWLMNAKEEDAEIEWMVHFTPFYESIEGRKMYTKLLLRMQLPKGAWMKAEIRCDGGMWRESGKVIGNDADTIPLHLPINRCDKLEVRLSGYGPCTIKAMMLEYKMGSDV